MSNLGFRNPWPEYRREKGDAITTPFDLGGAKPAPIVTKKELSFAHAQGVALAAQRVKTEDRGGKPTPIVELDSLFLVIERELMGCRNNPQRAQRVKQAMYDLQQTRKKLSAMANHGKVVTVDIKNKRVVKPSVQVKTSQEMAAITRREVALFKARWASLLS